MRNEDCTLNKQHYRRTEVGLCERPAVTVPWSWGLDLRTVGLLSNRNMFQTRHRHAVALRWFSPRHAVRCRCVYAGCRRTADTQWGLKPAGTKLLSMFCELIEASLENVSCGCRGLDLAEVWKLGFLYHSFIECFWHSSFHFNSNSNLGTITRKNYLLHLLYLAQKLRFPVVLIRHNSKPKQSSSDVTCDIRL